MSQLRKKTRKKRVRPKHSKALKQIQEDLLCVLSTVANGRGLFVFTLLALMRTPPHTASKPSPKVKTAHSWKTKGKANSVKVQPFLQLGVLRTIHATAATNALPLP